MKDSTAFDLNHLFNLSKINEILFDAENQRDEMDEIIAHIRIIAADLRKLRDEILREGYWSEEKRLIKIIELDESIRDTDKQLRKSVKTRNEFDKIVLSAIIELEN